LLFDKLFLEVHLKLQKSDGTKPASKAQVGLVNNIVHSLFSDVKYSINGTPMNPTSSANYAYKAFLKDTVQFNTQAKLEGLRLQGFMSDMASMYDNKLNPGFMRRRAAFLASTTGISPNETEVFRSDAVPFIGLLHSDFQNLEQGKLHSFFFF
jgi:hypothetical protein